MLRLPNSARSRNELSYLKVLRRINLDAPSGFGFEGSFRKPGALVSYSELFPAPDYPPSPVLLECAGSTGTTPDGKKAGRHGRSQQVYILWRLNPDCTQWIEVMRAASDSWQWVSVLRPAAERALRESRGLRAYSPDLPAITDRIGHFLDSELESLSPPDRMMVLTSIHDHLAVASVRNGAAV